MRIEVKNKRQKKRLTQVQTAKMLNVSERYYQQIESGTRKGDVDLWINLCKLLDIKTIEELEGLLKNSPVENKPIQNNTPQ